MREGRGPHDLAAAKLAVTSVLDHSEPTGFCRVEAIRNRRVDSMTWKEPWAGWLPVNVPDHAPCLYESW